MDTYIVAEPRADRTQIYLTEEESAALERASMVRRAVARQSRNRQRALAALRDDNHDARPG